MKAVFLMVIFKHAFGRESQEKSLGKKSAYFKLWYVTAQQRFTRKYKPTTLPKP